MTSNRIALVFDRAYVDAQFCFREMVTHLCDHDWEVDLYIPFSPWHPVPAFNHDRLKIHFFDHSYPGLLRLLSRLNRIGSKKYDAIIATPQWALYWSARVGQLRRIPVICLPDECFMEKNGHETEQGTAMFQSERKWKRREIWAHHRCAFSVATGEWWFLNIIKKTNLLPDQHPYVLLPNAPSGNATSLKNYYYRDVLEIPDDRKILLYSGGMEYSFVRELIEKASSWSCSWCIVFQDRRSNDRQYPTKAQNIRFSKFVLPAELMRYATSSADIGLMLYNRDVPFESRAGSESGKLGLYLSCGLPIISCNADVLSWIQEEGCGVCVPHLDAIPEAARKIMANYESFRQNARRVFDEKFEYSRFFPHFLEKLKGVTNSMRQEPKPWVPMNEKRHRLSYL